MVTSDMDMAMSCPVLVHQARNNLKNLQINLRFGSSQPSKPGKYYDFTIDRVLVPEDLRGRTIQIKGLI